MHAGHVRYLRTGIDVAGSAAALSNIEVVKCQNLPDEPTLIRPNVFIGLSVTYRSEVQLSNGFTINSELPKFVSNVPGANCSSEIGPETDTCKRLSSIGIDANDGSSLELESGMIEMVGPLGAGLKLLELESFVARNSSTGPTLRISKARRAISVYGGAKFRDSSTKVNPTQDKRLSIIIEDTGWGIWADKGNFEAPFADIAMEHCSESCLHAANEGQITIGRDSFSEIQPMNIVSKVSLNTVTAQNTRVIDVGFGTTAMINRPCASGGLGNVRVNQGSVSVTASSNTQTSCTDSISLKSCIDTEVAKNYLGILN
jgi:hypothetical protein